MSLSVNLDKTKTVQFTRRKDLRGLRVPTPFRNRLQLSTEV